MKRMSAVRLGSLGSVLGNVRSAHAITILLVLEMLILAELTEQSEENVQTFYE